MKSQKEIIKDALLRGETLVRRDLQESGISVVTEWKVARSRKTGRKISYATYYIPERRKERRLSWKAIRNKLFGGR